MPRVAAALLMFVPERWGQLDHFSKLHGNTYKFDQWQRRALAGVGSHLRKTLILHELGLKLKPGLEDDHRWLDEHGHSPMTNSAELATVLEAAFLELYSSIDCTAKVLRAVYGPTTRGFKESTSGMFKNADRFEGSFPPELKEAIRDATWYWRLRTVRDELTHLSTGHVRWDRETDIVNYSNFDLPEQGKFFDIPDVFAWIGEMYDHVNRFIGIAFHYMNGTLGSEPVFQLCGMVEGRGLHRYVNPTEKLTFHSGECGAWAWFELPENPDCPFKDHCGAYQRKAPPQGWETSPASLSDPAVKSQD